MRDFGRAVPAVPAVSHAIPSDVFHGLKCDRWNSADSALVWGWAELELRAKLRGLVVAMVLVPQGHCSASLPLQCCAIWCIGAVSSALLRRVEIGDTFADPSERWLETGDTFARGKCWFFGC